MKKKIISVAKFLELRRILSVWGLLHDFKLRPHDFTPLHPIHDKDFLNISISTDYTSYIILTLNINIDISSIFSISINDKYQSTMLFISDHLQWNYISVAN